MHLVFFIFAAFLINFFSWVDATESAFPLYLNGYMGPKAGYMPPPGLYLRNDYYHHPGHVKAAVLGGRVSGKSNVKISLDLLNVTYVSHKKLLGADVACGVLIPFGKID